MNYNTGVSPVGMAMQIREMRNDTDIFTHISAYMVVVITVSKTDPE